LTEDQAAHHDSNAPAVLAALNSANGGEVIPNY
jgi:hypothetical protein